MKMKKVLAVALSMACASTLFVATAVTASAADKKEVGLLRNRRAERNDAVPD